MSERKFQRCTNCVMDTTDSAISFDEKGVCDFCNDYYRNILPNWHVDEESKAELLAAADKIKKKSKNKKYDCIIGMSGGVDSSYLCYIAKEVMGLRPLLYAADTGWNLPVADENIEKIFEITDKAGLIYMSHTQDPAHAERLVSLSKGRRLHLAHATAAGCGSHADPVEGMKRVLALVNGKNISAEFVTTMLRKGRGSREGLQMPKEAQQVAYDALASGKVNILISDGQNDATMKGFGDTRDNIPAILELAEMGVWSLSQSVASMTYNPAKLIGETTHNPWWTEKCGHIGVGALANITVIDPDDKLATYTIVNGNIVSFENRIVRRNSGAGGWISKFGMLRKTGIGDLAAFSYTK